MQLLHYIIFCNDQNVLKGWLYTDSDYIIDGVEVEFCCSGLLWNCCNCLVYHTIGCMHISTQYTELKAMEIKHAHIHYLQFCLTRTIFLLLFGKQTHVDINRMHSPFCPFWPHRFSDLELWPLAVAVHVRASKPRVQLTFSGSASWWWSKIRAVRRVCP